MTATARYGPELRDTDVTGYAGAWPLVGPLPQPMSSARPIEAIVNDCGAFVENPATGSIAVSLTPPMSGYCQA